jgi:hypothetical protein
MTTATPNNISITLLSFNKTVSIDKAGLIYNEIYDPHFTGYDAEVTTNVDLLTFKKMFCFQSDYIDVNDINNLDVKYYVLKNRIVSFLPDFQNAITSLNPIVSVNSNGSILTSADQIIGKDFIRFLASLLFNTPYGTDLFVNEEELVVSVTQALNQAWSHCANDLQNISNESTSNVLPMVGNSPAKYLTNDTTSVLNICRELFLQIISKSPTRFTNMPNLEDTGSDIQDIQEGNLKYYNLPFVAGDCIKIQVKLYPAVNQDTFGLTPLNSDKFETVNNISQLKGRTYLINMILNDNSPIILPTTQTQTLTLIPNSFDASIGTRSTESTIIAQPFVSAVSASMASKPYCSFKVTGKNNSLVNGKLEYLPVLQDPAKLKIEATTMVEDANTLIIKMYYEVITSASGVGIGFSQEAINYYNNNIEILEFLEFGGFPLFDGGFQFMSLNSILYFSATDSPTIQNPTSLRGAFSNMPRFTSLDILSTWELNNVTDVSFMLAGATSFNQPIDLSGLPQVTNISSIFAGATSFNKPLDLSVLPQVTNISSMLSGATSFNKPLIFPDLPQFTNMSSMFAGATSFNQNIYFPDLPHVTNMSRMFAGATSFNQQIFFPSLPQVTNMSSMFAGASSFNQEIYFVDLPQVTNMSSMFAGATSFNQNIYFPDLPQLTNMSSMFAGATSFNPNIYFPDLPQVTNMSSMFAGATSFNQELIFQQLSQLTNMSSMFEGATAYNNGGTLLSLYLPNGISNLNYTNYDAGCISWETSNKPEQFV